MADKKFEAVIIPAREQRRSQRVAIIGAGMMAYELAVEIQRSGGTIDTIVDVSKENAQKMIDELNLTNVRRIVHISDYQSVVDDDSIDGIVNTSPSALHYGYTIAAVKAGKAVYSEKPFTTNVAHAEEILRVALEKNVAVQVNSQYRWTNVLDEVLKDMIMNTSKALGACLGQRHTYRQTWQNHPLVDIGGRAIKAWSGDGKVTPDLLPHEAMTTHHLHDFEGGVSKLDGQMFCVHANRMLLKKPAGSFAGGQAPSYMDAPNEYWWAQMMKNPKISGGDDFTVAVGTYDRGKGEPVPFRWAISHAEQEGSHEHLANGYEILVEFENGFVLWNVEDPNRLHVTYKKGKTEIIERNGSPTTRRGQPGGHNRGWNDMLYDGVYEWLEAIRDGPAASRALTEKHIGKGAVHTVKYADQLIKKGCIQYDPRVHQIDGLSPVLPTAIPRNYKPTIEEQQKARKLIAYLNKMAA